MKPNSRIEAATNAGCEVPCGLAFRAFGIGISIATLFIDGKLPLRIAQGRTLDTARAGCRP
jgi:hypothetical protein